MENDSGTSYSSVRTDPVELHRESAPLYAVSGRYRPSLSRPAVENRRLSPQTRKSPASVGAGDRNSTVVSGRSRTTQMRYRNTTTDAATIPPAPAVLNQPERSFPAPELKV